MLLNGIIDDSRHFRKCSLWLDVRMWKQLAATSSRQIRWMKNLTRCRICAYFHFTNYNFLMIVLVHSLLDPSCSGSGIVNRMDYLMEHGGVADPHRCQTRINCVKRRSGL